MTFEEIAEKLGQGKRKVTILSCGKGTISGFSLSKKIITARIGSYPPARIFSNEIIEITD